MTGETVMSLAVGPRKRQDVVPEIYFTTPTNYNF